MSFTFQNLPGVQVATVDGGLAAVNSPTTKAILVLGTSAIGPANSPFQVVSLAAAAKAFGLNGTLIRGMSEAAVYSDNVSLFRVGTAQASVLVGHTASSTTGTNNIIFKATSVGGQITYDLGAAAPSVDLHVGDPLAISGFANTNFNSPGANPRYVVASLGAHSIVVDAPIGTVPDATEGEYTDAYSTDAFNNDFAVITGVKASVSGGIATLDYTSASQPLSTALPTIHIGDTVVLLGVDSAGAAFGTELNGTFIISGKTTNTISFGTGLTPDVVPTVVNQGTLKSSDGVTANATSATSLTLSYSAADHTKPAVKVGDLVTLASFADSSRNQTYTVASTPGSSIVLTGVGLTVAGPDILEVGTFSSHAVNPGALFIPAQDGFLVQFGQVDSAYRTRYKIYYDGAGILTIWLDNNIVFSNDPAINLNTGDSEVTGSSTGGTVVDNGTHVDALANALTVDAAITGAKITLVNDVVTGIGLSARDLYIAQQNAMDLLQGFPIDIVVVPGALSDQANVVTLDSVASADTLDYLWTGKDVNNNAIYQWASEASFRTFDNRTVGTATLLGQGSPTTPTIQSFTDAATRLAAGVGVANLQQNGFHEVGFAYQLARFCAAQSEAPQADNGGALGFIGTKGPVNLSDFSLSSVRNWIGHLPVYDPISGLATVSGSGMLGIPFLVGASPATLHVAASNRTPARIPGLFATDSGEYDGGAEIDANGFKVDIGAYIQVVGDYALQSNGFGTYVGNIAGVVAGLTSSLDAKRAITNKQVAGVSQLYRASLQQLDDLTFADVDVLRFKGPGQLPVILHDKTSATAASDYTLALRQRIKFLVIQTLLREADNFIGNGTNDGLSLTALKTALDADLLGLQKRGYLSKYTFTITSTKAQQKIGQASIQISFVPANELVQLNATVGINLAA